MDSRLVWDLSAAINGALARSSARAHMLSRILSPPSRSGQGPASTT